ncbi:hypothetical protein [Actinoallomurus iriomotensis]|uniref:Uncharacterized protein n=1 Tax=Actinoallomurus iriomotensis TaxID=478107 RepID=A0A9W6RFI9_9ACTN|nr:hypothetical protein [Actinoallomurus iriomotensis]GLY74639.1 hypothetical protein Airi01_029060 [Actinoallomurus iriomotensis]
MNSENEQAQAPEPSAGFRSSPGPYLGSAPHTAQPPYGDLPQRPRKRDVVREIWPRILVGVVALLILAVGGAVSAWQKADKASHAIGPQREITPPPSLDTYTGEYERATDKVADKLMTSMRTSAGDESTTQKSIAQKAIIAVYEKNHDFDQRFAFFGVTGRSDLGVAEEFRSRSPLARADRVLHAEGGLTGTSDFAAGPLGGVLRCATSKSKSNPSSTCVWADGSTLGLLVAPKIDAPHLASLALTFRNASEH